MCGSQPYKRDRFVIDVMSTAEKQVIELLDCVLDGSASDADQRRFAHLMKTRHELTAEFVEQLRMHSLLQWKSDQLYLPAPCGLVTMPTSRISSGRSSFASALDWRWAIAAVVLLACGVGILPFSAISYRSHFSIAEIVQDREARWDGASAAIIRGKSLYPGRLELVSGTSSLQLRNGATVSLVGPVSMRIDSDFHVHLDRGKIMAEVPHTIKGFAIETPVAAVVDRGTRFQVDAHEDGGVEVAVYDGAVDVHPTNSDSAVVTCLRQQEAAQIDKQGKIVRLIRFEQEPTSEQWNEVRQLPTITIEAVRGVVASTNERLPCLINARGLADDSRAYVDHPDEWNGMTADGLPKFLQYADYIRTPDNVRYLADLEFEIDLTRPAWLYVIYDDRSPVPTWLKSQFQDTGVKVGLDEGPWPGETPNLSLGIGPGKSIDVVFTVWRRRCDKAGTVRLGAMAKGPEARAMYGIAATPLY
jgi:FecR protein